MSDQEKITQWRQAIGLATTIVPDMVTDADDPVGIIHQVLERVSELSDLAATALTIIANAHGGNWDLATEASGWKAAAERWCKKYHALPSEVRCATAETEEPAEAKE